MTFCLISLVERKKGGKGGGFLFRCYKNNLLLIYTQKERANPKNYFVSVFLGSFELLDIANGTLADLV